MYDLWRRNKLALSPEEIIDHPKTSIDDGRYVIYGWREVTTKNEINYDFVADNLDLASDDNEAIRYLLPGQAIEISEPEDLKLKDNQVGILKVIRVGGFRRAIYTPNEAIKLTGEE